MSLKVVEICAGAGGQSLGLMKAGFEHALAVELDESAAATLKHNLLLHGEVDAQVAVGDVASPEIWTPEDFAGVDLLAGGVPCPPFSVAGKQLGSRDERDLFAWAVELVGRMRPRAVLLENVRGLSMPRFAAYRQAVADRLDSMGYWSEWRLLQASDFGVPQLRPRFVLVALDRERSSAFAWPEPLEVVPTVGSALRDLMGERGWKHVEDWARGASDIGPTIVGGSKKHGGADLGPTRARAGWAKLGVDGRGVANEAPGADAPSATEVMPRLTNEMVARVQGWGAPGYEWEFLGRKTSVYRQIGNAFPPPVAAAVGRQIAQALTQEAGAVPVGSQVVHDPVYLALRQASSPLTVDELTAVTADPLTREQVSKSLRALESDFAMQKIRTDDGTAYRLGDFLAFQGQVEHARHSYFEDKVLRSRVS